MSCFNFAGFIEEVPGISVDSFQDDNFNHSSALFLSHCHADHMENLYEGFKSGLEDDSSLRLFCSVDSETILRNKLTSQYGDSADELLDEVVQTLSLNTEYTINVWGKKVEVTAIKANHCAGSCMFLFKTDDDTVLYTGDFRYHTYQLSKIDALHDDDGDQIDLDNIYLDTTFLKQTTLQFPTRKKVLHLITNEIDEYLENVVGNKIVHINRPANIGSELIIKTLSQKYSCLIHVESSLYNLYDGINHVFPYITSDPSNTFIHMCKPGKPGTNYLCKHHRGLNIRASALWYAYQDDTDWVQVDSNGRVNIAHSMHSSRKELNAFINYFQPTRAVALVTPEDFSHQEIQEELDELVESASA